MSNSLKNLGTLPDISSLSELKAHRARLKAEADTALNLLQDRSKVMLKQNTTKVATAVAVPVALATLGKMGLNQITDHGPYNGEATNWSGEIQRGWQSYQTKPANKWMAFLPMILKMGLAYLAKEEAKEMVS